MSSPLNEPLIVDDHAIQFHVMSGPVKGVQKYVSTKTVGFFPYSFTHGKTVIEFTLQQKGRTNAITRNPWIRVHPLDDRLQVLEGQYISGIWISVGNQKSEWLRLVCHDTHCSHWLYTYRRELFDRFNLIKPISTRKVEKLSSAMVAFTGAGVPLLLLIWLAPITYLLFNSHISMTFLLTMAFIDFWAVMLLVLTTWMEQNK